MHRAGGIDVFAETPSALARIGRREREKKADAGKRPRALDRVGLLFNGPAAEATCPSPSHPTHTFSFSRRAASFRPFAGNHCKVQNLNGKTIPFIFARD